MLRPFMDVAWALVAGGRIARSFYLMEKQNSLVRHMTDVFSHLLRDVANLCHVVSIDRDLDYVKARAAKEGASFFTKSLPLLGKSIDSSLGTNSTFLSPGLARAKGRTTPKFLGWLFEGVFDQEGRELLYARPDYVKHLRQLAYFFYKLELPYEDNETARTIATFVATEREIASSDLVSDLQLHRVIRTARNLVSRVCADVRVSEFIPKHGPGAVSCGTNQWEKMRFRRYYSQLEEVFPWENYFTSGAMDICDNYHRFHNRRVFETGTAKVVLVPKDSRGPRLISCEPAEYQFIQQGIARELVRAIESHEYTRGRVNFSDQSVNQRYALYGSLGAPWVTLDMKDASDRVRLDLVETLFGGSHILPYLLASRSTATKLPSGEIVPLKKFAPMGSALCFPVEALVFWALSVACSVHENADPVHFNQKLKYAMEGIHVYGDDLILRKEDYLASMQFFPRVGLKFNPQKCCTGGSFRESCGVDAYKGVIVTPVRYRTVWVSRRKTTKQLLSSVELSNHLYSHNYWETADYFMALIEREFGQLPILEHDRPVSYIAFRRLTASIYGKRTLRTKWCERTHKTLVRALVAYTPSFSRAMSGYEKLRWKLIQPNDSRDRGYIADLKTFARTFKTAPAIAVSSFPVRRRVTHKRRWCSYEQ
jgi:hypothetical protein